MTDQSVSWCLSVGGGGTASSLFGAGAAHHVASVCVYFLYYIFIYYICVYKNNDAPSHPDPGTTEAAGEEGCTAAPSFQQPLFEDHGVPSGCGVSAEGPGMTWALLEMESHLKRGNRTFSVLFFQLRGELLSPLL